MYEAPEELKVALIGSHGVGKTSILEPLALALGVPALGELATDIAKSMGYERIEHIPPTEVTAFQWNIVHQQIARELKTVNYVSDRSTVCNAAYWTRYVYQAGKASQGEHEAYLRIARAHAREYTHLVLFPIAFQLEDDGFRHTDPVEQREIEKLVLGFVDAWDLRERVHIVKSDGKIARIAEILQVVEDSSAVRRASIDSHVFVPLLDQRPEVLA